MLGASGIFFQLVRLSAMIRVDCMAAWLKEAYSTISRCTRAPSFCSVSRSVCSSATSLSISFTEVPATRWSRLPILLVTISLSCSGCRRWGEFTDFPFHLRLDCLAGLNRFVRFLARFHECHVDFPVCTPVWRFPSLQLPHDNVTASRPCRGFRKYLGAVRVWNLLPCRIANLRRSCRRYSNTATTLLRLDSGHRLAEILRYCLR